MAFNNSLLALAQRFGYENQIWFGFLVIYAKLKEKKWFTFRWTEGEPDVIDNGRVPDSNQPIFAFVEGFFYTL